MVMHSQAQKRCVYVCISLAYYYQGPVQGLTKHIAARLTSKDVKNKKNTVQPLILSLMIKVGGFLYALKVAYMF
jgi:hypothetical protein